MLKFSKVRNVKSPIRANTTDAGIDLFIPEELDESVLMDKNPIRGHYRLVENKIRIYAHSRVLIPSGLHFNIDNGFALIAANKSGIASKLGLIFGAQVVDSGYQGEVHINLINTTDEFIDIPLGSKVIQFLYMPVRNDIPEEVDFNKLYSESTNRGDGGFGSTGV